MTTAVAAEDSPLLRERKPVTAAMRLKAAEVLKKAKVQLAIHHPFFAQIVFNRPITIDDNTPTAKVSNRGKIVVGTQFMSELTVMQGVFLLAHEAMHYAMLHGLRRGARDPAKWNYAGDAVINDVLIASKAGDFIPGGVNMPGSKDKTSEKVYEELPEGTGGGKHTPGEGLADLDNDGGEGSDEPPIDEAEAREIEQQARVELAQAAQVAKQQGKLPAGIDRLIEDIINPITPWHILLERYMTALIRSGYSWRRPNKKMMGASGGVLYLPSQDTLPKMGEVFIAVDTSGSIGQEELAHFLGHINSILEKCRPEKVYICPCDAQTYEVAEITLDDLPVTAEHAQNAKMFAGGGGTSFKPPFEWVREHGIEPEVFIYLTDMYGDFPEAPHYPVVWLSTSDVKEAPFGDVIPYRIG